ncbi:type IV secretion system DNA-binding domain-containing protein [Burkholderia contaminans]|uniref:type IV secretion system DNA-binding domain-containing protein n=1 Tax=Burkholderia contaminans TaxID=488447 RepID=UPI001589DC6B|nr:type IV secretion system DNA-binding domain-containing protein [Burkholderia contaminans]
MFQENQDVQVSWRSRNNVKIKVGNHAFIYYQDYFITGLFYAFLAFVVTTFLLWCINIPPFVRPPKPQFIEALPNFLTGPGDFVIHLIYWWMILLNKIPILHPFQAQVDQYRLMGAWLDQHGLLYIIVLRWLIAFGASVAGFVYGGNVVINNPIPQINEKQVRGMRVLTGALATREWAKQTASEVKRSGVFTEIAKHCNYSYQRLKTHILTIGASGSGKSQFFEPLLRAAMKLRMKVVILDVKYEFTEAFYDENDPSVAILDPTDSRSHVWDMAKDIQEISKIRRFANAFIPPSEGEGAMWANAARQLFTGAMIYLNKKLPDYTPKDLSDIFANASADEFSFIMEKYFAPGLKAAGLRGEDGKVEENVTSFGIQMNLSGYIDGLVDIGRFWYNPNQKRISLFEFMTDPDYPIKTILIKPNDSEKLMSSSIIRSMLTYMISMIDSPDITNSKAMRGIFFLDEFQAPGKLADEAGDPVVDKLMERGRSKGWSVFLAVQDIIQLIITYSENDLKKWRAVSSNFALTGTPLGDTAQMVSDLISKEYFHKENGSYGYDDKGRQRAGDKNVQEHDRPVILPSEISAYLNPTEPTEDSPLGNIRFLFLGKGLKDAFILEKPIVPIEGTAPPFVAQKQNIEFKNPDSRIMKLLRQEILDDKKAKELAEKKTDVSEIKKAGETKPEDYIPAITAVPYPELEYDEIPEGEDIIEEERVDLHSDDDEEIVLSDKQLIDKAKQTFNAYQTTELLKLSSDMRLTSTEKQLLDALIVGRFDEIPNGLYSTIMKDYGQNPKFKLMVDFIQSLNRYV